MRCSSSGINWRRGNPGGIGSRKDKVIRPGRLTKARRPQNSPELTAAADKRQAERLIKRRDSGLIGELLAGCRSGALGKDHHRAALLRHRRGFRHHAP